MNFSPMRHPRILASLEIVRDRREPSFRSAIRSISIFTVTRCPDYCARFSSEHYAFDRDCTRADIINGIAKSIALDATLIAKAHPPSEHRLRHAFVSGGPVPPTDLQLIRRQRKDLEVLSLECGEAALDETAAFYGMRRAGPGSSIVAQSRRAADEAQVLWATFLATCCRQADRTSFGSAFAAWRAIESARPLPF